MHDITIEDDQHGKSLRMGAAGTAEAGEAGGERWTAEQLRLVAETYGTLARLEAARIPFDACDYVCRLSRTACHRFSESQLRLANIAWLVKSREEKCLACIAPSGEMPDETRAILEGLLDEGAHR